MAPPAGQRDVKRIKIATYNVNGIKARLPHLRAWLEATGPDIVCLQEIKTSDDKFPIAAIEDCGYGAMWHGQRSFHGVAILVKDKSSAELRRGLPDADADTQARYLECRCEGLDIASVYLPNGNPQPGPKFDYKLAWSERLIAHANALQAAGRPTLLCGDFNIVPTDADIYDADAWRWDAVMQPESRSVYRRLMEAGWVDATRKRFPNERIYTYWDYGLAFRRNQGFRMDFLLLSRSLADALEDTGVDKAFRGMEGASDHAPVWVVLRVPAPH